MLLQSGDDPAGDSSAIHDQTDLVVGNSLHVIGRRWVEHGQSHCFSLPIPPFEHGLGDRTVEKSEEAGSSLARRPQERSVGGSADRDVIGVPEEPVRTERRHDGRLFLVQDDAGGVDEFVEWDLIELSAREVEPFLAIGLSAQRSPPVLVFQSADATE